MTMPIEVADPRNISNSEVTTWLTCRQQYYFAFFLNLAPKVTGKALSRGTVGHDAFSRYIDARLNGSNHDQSLKAMEGAYREALRLGTGADVVLHARLLVDRYMAFHNGWPEWELLGTEERLDLPVNEGFSIPIRYDLMVRDIQTDKKLVGDFKFTYDFWSPDDHSLNGQAPKYITVMNYNGLGIDGGFLEEIRTRELGPQKVADKKNLWRRTRYFPSMAKKRSTMKQHLLACEEIVEYRNMSEEDREMKTIPVLNKHGACKFCNFKDLCNSKLDGKKDLSVDIAHGYVQNTYGYNATLPNVDSLGELL